MAFTLIQIIGHEVRPLTSKNQKDAILNAYNKWLSTAKEN
jgi:hypothetical protein